MLSLHRKLIMRRLTRATATKVGVMIYEWSLPPMALGAATSSARIVSRMEHSEQRNALASSPPSDIGRAVCSTAYSPNLPPTENSIDLLHIATRTFAIFK